MGEPGWKSLVTGDLTGQAKEVGFYLSGNEWAAEYFQTGQRTTEQSLQKLSGAGHVAD